MGDPLEPGPPPAGDDCDVCWGVGKTFGDIPTPSKIRVRFEGIESCPAAGPAPNGDYILTQDPDVPCRFRYGDLPALAVRVRIFDAPPFVWVTMDEGELGIDFWWFDSAPCGLCATEFTNMNLHCPIGQGGKNGTAKIYLKYMDDASQITYGYGLTQVIPMKKEDMPAAGDEKVVFIAGYKDNTKCLIKYDPDQLV